MTREYAARKLLRHGRLTLAQFVEITGWSRQECRRVLRTLVRKGFVFFDGMTCRGHYLVAWEYD